MKLLFVVLLANLVASNHMCRDSDFIEMEAVENFEYIMKGFNQYEYITIPPGLKCQYNFDQFSKDRMYIQNSTEIGKELWISVDVYTI